MKKILVLLLSVIILTPSCSNESENEFSPLVGGQDEQKTETYVFSSIKYSFREGDGVEESLYTAPSVVFTNKTASEMTVSSVNPVCEDLKQKSQFIPENKPEQNIEINDSITIGIPYSVDSNTFEKEKWFTVSGNTEWKYSELPEESADTTKIADKLTVPSFKSLKVDRTFKKRVVQTSYIATFVGKETGKVVEVYGKWKGVGYSTFSVKLNELEIE
ncbi:MAG: hypothetical protein LBT43_02505 [Prevotella sp.]|jgi:hypothetical protein|nr:hypothetical protein [Prevotella sp.]